MARKKTVIPLFFGAVVVLAMSVSAAEAAPSRFTTKDECERAVNAGRYEVYPPRYFKNHNKNPVDGVTKVAAPLEFLACVDMATTSGRKWVVAPLGAEFRFHVAEDGSLIQPPYARHDCGNEVYDISYPQEEIPDVPEKNPPPRSSEEEGKKEVVKTEETLVRDVCGELGLYGDNFTSRINEKGRPYCYEDTPWYKSGWVQYPVNTVVGGTVGYLKAGSSGAVVGALSGATGTFLGREIAGEGNEEWGWVGLGTGILGGSLMHKTGGGGTSSGGGGTTGGGGPSGGGSGI